MIKVIGIGPGSTDYVTPLAMEEIKQADVLVGGERLLQAFALKGQEVYPVKNNLAEVVEFIKERAGSKRVAVLASGDPGMYGILNYLMKHFRPEELEVVPGISSVQLACARLRISWHDAVLTSVHGREMGNLVDLVRGNEKVVILTDHKTTPAVVAAELLKSGIINRKAWVCRNLSYDTEMVREFDLEGLLKSPDFPGSILILIEANTDGVD